MNFKTFILIRGGEVDEGINFDASWARDRS